MEGVMDSTALHENAALECRPVELRRLAAIHFVPRCVNRRGDRKLVEYERRFESSYQSSKLPAYIKEKILSTLLALLVEPYSSGGGQRSLQTHPLDSLNLRREGWIQDLRGTALVSRVNNEWRIVWSMASEKVVVHAACRHQDLYST